MYFVRYDMLVYRYTGTHHWEQSDLPDDTVTYDYDDASRWEIGDLEKEARQRRKAHELTPGMSIAISEEMARRRHEDEPDTTDNWQELMDWLTELDDEDFDDDDFDDEDFDDFDDEDMAYIRAEVVTPEQITLPIQKKIRDVAKIERENIELQKTVRDKDGKPDAKLQLKLDALNEKAQKARDALMDSEFADTLQDVDDPIATMKNMASQLLFLYVQSRLDTSIHGGEPEEDYFYAGAHFYAMGAALQLLDEAMHDEGYDEDDEDDEDDGDSGKDGDNGDDDDLPF